MSTIKPAKDDIYTRRIEFPIISSPDGSDDVANQGGTRPPKLRPHGAVVHLTQAAPGEPWEANTAGIVVGGMGVQAGGSIGRSVRHNMYSLDALPPTLDDLRKAVEDTLAALNAPVGHGPKAWALAPAEASLRHASDLILNWLHPLLFGRVHVAEPKVGPYVSLTELPVSGVHWAEAENQFTAALISCKDGWRETEKLERQTGGGLPWFGEVRAAVWNAQDELVKINPGDLANDPARTAHWHGCAAWLQWGYEQSIAMGAALKRAPQGA